MIEWGERDDSIQKGRFPSTGEGGRKKGLTNNILIIFLGHRVKYSTRGYYGYG